MKTRDSIRSFWALAAAALMAAPALGVGSSWAQTYDASLQGPGQTVTEEYEGIPEDLRGSPQEAAETGATYARLLYYEGGLSLRRPADLANADEEMTTNAPLVPGDEIWTGADGRAEVQLADGSILRIDRDSRVGLLNLADLNGAFDTTTLLRLPSGSLYVQAANFDARQRRFQIDTPSGSVFLLSEGIFRIDVSDSGTTTVASFRGVAELLADQNSAIVHSGERISAGPGRAPGEARAFNTLRRDNFDLWAESRDDAIAAARSARGPDPSQVPAPVRPYVTELSHYGSWQDTPEYGWVWLPRVAHDDWRPYHYGRWSSAPIGMVWVSSEPWGYAPYHYGRWQWGVDLGWFWAPGYVYSGAYVRWSVGPYYYGWGPIGYYGYPVLHASYGYGHHHHWTYIHHSHIYRHGVHRHSYGYNDVVKHRMHERAHHLRSHPRADRRYRPERTGQDNYRRARSGKDVVPRHVSPPPQKTAFKDRDRRNYVRRAARGRTDRSSQAGLGPSNRSGRRSQPAVSPRSRQAGARKSTPTVGSGRERPSGPARRIQPTRVSHGKSRVAPTTRTSPVTGRTLKSTVKRTPPRTSRGQAVKRTPPRTSKGQAVKRSPAARGKAAYRSPSRSQTGSGKGVTTAPRTRTRPHGKIGSRGRSRSGSPFIMVLPDKSGQKSGAARVNPRSGSSSSRQKVSRAPSSRGGSKASAQSGKRSGGGKAKGGKGSKGGKKK